MKSKKNKKKASEKKTERGKKSQKQLTLEDWKAMTYDFIDSIALIKSNEANWNNKEIVLSFDHQDDMVPFMHIVGCVFAITRNKVNKKPKK